MPRRLYSKNFGQILSIALDCANTVFIFYIAQWIRYGDRSFAFLQSWEFIGFLVTILFVLYLFDPYKTDRGLFGLNHYFRFFIAITILIPAVSFFVFISFPLRPSMFGRGILSIFFIAFYVWNFFLRFIIRTLFSNKSEWLLIGSSSQFSSIQDDIKKKSFIYNMNISTTEGSDKNVLTAIQSRSWTGLIICDENSLSKELAKTIMHYRFSGKFIYKASDFYEFLLAKVPTFCLENQWFVFTEGFYLSHSNLSLKFKRIFDITLSLILSITTLPLAILVAVLIKLESKGPVFYTQKRVGFNNKIFTMFKFRSMKENSEDIDGLWTTKKDKRITKIGKIIRFFRFDEVPQLINIFKGAMSFIGPRPVAYELTKVLERKIPFYNTRHIVRPGLTGWAQVLYAYPSSIDGEREKFQYDLYYIKNFSFFLDFFIFLKTFKVVIFGRG